jgi:selenocysteine-specific elongation factor
VTDRQFVIATAGHIDHGKSALVKALTGTDPDRLPEEKARQITIELGFAQLNLVAKNGENLRVSIVDVPGHEDFVRNMIAGVGAIDLALLVVAADDGWMPQTEEHLQILTYLGATRAVIALTKADLGDARNAAAQIRDRLIDTPFSQSPIIPTSVHLGTGLTELKDALALHLASAPSRSNVGKPRLFVDRAFTLRGIGTVATGTLTGGTLRRGQNVIIQSKNLAARIRSLQSHGREVSAAQPGMRTALNLPDTAVGASARAVKRGDVVTTDTSSPSATLDVVLQRLSAAREKDPQPRLLKTGASVDIHHGTSRVAAKVALLDQETLKRGERAIAQLRLVSPLFAYLGDRLIMRDQAQQHTIAGGIVLDPDGDRRRFRADAQRKLLARRASAFDDVDVCVASEIEREGVVRLTNLVAKSLFSAEEIAAALQRLRARGQVVQQGDLAAHAEVWQSLRRRAIKLIDEVHAKERERVGLDLNELRHALRDHPPEVLDALVADLCANGFVRHGQVVARISHQAALSPHLEIISQKIQATLSINPFDPPSRKLLAPDRNAQQTLEFLIDQGSVVEIAPDLILLRENFELMKRALQNFLSKNGPATVSELRQELKTSRRVIVPLLEYLDRHGVTRRVRDPRILAH